MYSSWPGTAAYTDVAWEAARVSWREPDGRSVRGGEGTAD